MNILELQEALKDMSQNQLVREAQQPSGVAPSFMVVSELKRRQDMRQRYQNQAPKATVADEVVGRSLQPMMPQQMPQPMPQQMPQQMPMQQPMMQQPIMQEEPRRMAIGGLVRGIGSLFKRKIPTAPTAVENAAMQSIKRTTPKDPQISGLKRLNPFLDKRGKLSQDPFTFTKGLLSTGLATTPIGAAALFSGPSTMGDGTMAGRFGLSEEDFGLIVQEAEKRGITPYDDRFADFVTSFNQSQEPMSREEMIAQMQEQGQETQAEGAERPKSYIEQLMENVEQREERGRKLGLAQLGLEIASRAGEGKPFLTSVSEAGLAALPQFQKAGDARTEMLGALAEAEMKAASEGGADVDALIDYRENLAEALQNAVLTEKEKQMIRSQLSAVDARIQRALGIASTAGSQSQGLVAGAQMVKQERQAQN